jgi:hypothetical protein
VFDGIHSKINEYFKKAIAESADSQLCYLDELLKRLRGQDDIANKLPPSSEVVLPPVVSSSSSPTRRSSRLKARRGVKRKLSEGDYYSSWFVTSIIQLPFSSLTTYPSSLDFRSHTYFVHPHIHIVHLFLAGDNDLFLTQIFSRAKDWRITSFATE